MMKQAHRIAMVGTALILLLGGCATPTQTTYTRPTPAPEPPKPPPPPKAPTATANALEISRVTNDQAPQFWPRLSPDGTQLLYTTFDKTRVEKKERISIKDISAGFSVVLMEMGKPGKKLVAGPYACDAAWYPDGTKFVYQYYKMEKPLLVRTPAGGVGMTFISPSALGDYDGQPDVSPDGSLIAFHTNLGGTTHLCTVNANGGNFTVYAEGCSPRWHPKEKLLAFDRVVGEKSQCFLFDLNSGQVTQLTSGSAENCFPVWSPDGEWLAFLSDRDGKRHVYCMKRDGGHVVQLTTGGTNENFIEWGSDGYLYFASDAGAPTATGEKEIWHWNFANIWRLKPVLNE